MGTDINGWVEVQAFPEFPDDPWVAVVDIGMLLGRDYDLFGCLFGVMNFAHFRPIVPLRGLSANASTVVQQETSAAAAYDDGMLWPTWISLPEIQALDQDELALYPDSRITKGVLTGDPSRAGKAGWSAGITYPPSRGSIDYPGVGARAIYDAGLVWEENGMRMSTHILTRREVLSVEWWRLVRMMELLGEQFGSEHVRLVVWFDR
jgi:hypothetical protein